MANVIVKHNITGMGRDTENAAEFYTRFRFPKELCDFFDREVCLQQGRFRGRPGVQEDYQYPWCLLCQELQFRW